MSQVKKGGLGRGLGALLKGVDIDTPIEPTPTAPAKAETDTPPLVSPASIVTSPPAQRGTQANTQANTQGNTQANTKSNITGDVVSQVDVDLITRGTYQPRQYFDDEALQELADSIAAQGLIQPILLRKRGGGFELIAGERRWRAAQLIGLKKIPAIIREMNDGAVAAVTLIENIQREDLNPLEEARALHRLKSEFEMTHQDVADAVGRSRAAVSNLMRLLDLDERVADMLANGKIEMGHARALLSLPGDEQHAVAMNVYANGLTVRATEALVRGEAKPKPTTKKSSPEIKQNNHIKALENELAEKIGANVSIANKSGNKGTITVSYNSLDELDGILSHIN